MIMAMQKREYYRAMVLNPLSDEKCDFFPDALLVTQAGKILDILEFEKGKAKHKPASVKTFSKSVIIPGLFDLHFHWVQDDVREMPKDSLLEWLDQYTFPSEAKFSNKAYASKRARSFFKRLTRAGTIGGAVWSSIHEHATEAAMKEAKGHFIIGNVLMNMNSPKELTQTPKESLEVTKRLIKKFGKRLCFTPRFAISTDPHVMKKGSEMADEAHCFKQSHLSESKAEIDFVLELYRKLPGFRKVKNYTEIYNKTNMLGKRSLMAHGIHLSDKELKTLRKTKTSLIHCPTSNAPIKEKGLGSGLFDFRKVEKHKVKWALGSDIGGGPILSMFDVMRSFVDQHKKKDATYVKALYRSTLAGARVLHIDDRVGNLEKGKEATFLVVKAPKGNFKSAEALLKALIATHRNQRLKYDTMIQRVYLAGKAVSPQK
jgi:guanine deaminase